MKPTVTIRELKNKDTGIDVQIPSFKSEQGLLSSVYHYNVLVVTNLRVLKNNDHQDSDVVQFMIPRKDDHFVQLSSIVRKKFSDLSVPLIEKPSTGLFGDVNPKERKQELERFLRVVVTHQTLLQYYVTLEFFGVPSAVAYNYCHSLLNGQDPFSTQSDTISGKDKAEVEDETVDTEDLFPTSLDPDKDEDELAMLSTTDSASLFSADSEAQFEELRSVKLFEGQDMGGGLSRMEAPQLFLIPDEDVVERSRMLNARANNEEDDLFQINEDLDKILNVKPSISKPRTSVTAARPEVAMKPTNKPVVVKKPSLPPKPSTKKKEAMGDTQTELPTSQDIISTTKPEGSDDFDSIFQYIQENSQAETRCDLFS